EPRSSPAVSRQQIQATLALARDAFGQGHLDSVFEPLNRLFTTEPGDDSGDREFSVPMEAANQSVDPTIAMVCAWLLDSADALLPRDSWPWILVREAAFALAGEGRFAQAELDQLLKSDNVGPVGCLAAAFLLGKTNPRLARTFAEGGLKRLTPAEFHRDYR